MYVGNDEPSIEELLSDETARLLLARDGLDLQTVHRLVREAQHRLRRRDDAAGRAA